MSTTLAVLVPVLGAVSETFVRRHVEDLVPGHTVVVTVRDERGDRSGDLPVLELAPLLDEGQWLDEPNVHDAVLTFLTRWDAGAVLAEFLDVWAPLVPALRGAGHHVVAHGHGYDISSRLRDPRWVEEYAVYAGSHVVVPSRFAAGRLLGLGIGLDPSGVHVVPCGVDIPATPAPCRPSTGGVSCVAVGRMVAKKAPLLLMRAFALAVAASAPGTLRLTVVGDGPLFAAATEAAGELGLGGRAELLGSRPNRDVQQMLGAADLFVQHSITDPATGDEEGVPVAILEAMAAGLPVVSTRHAGIPEAVDDGGSGILVDEGDVDGMAAALCELAADGALRQRLGSAGRQAVATRFSWERERLALLELLGLPG